MRRAVPRAIVALSAEFHTCERIEAQAVVRRYAVGELVEEA